MIQQALVTDQMIADAVTAAGLTTETIRGPGPGPLASPSYKALESASVFADGPEGAVFVKVLHPEMALALDMEAAMQLAVQAAKAGVGPRVIWCDAVSGAIAMEALTDTAGWKTARQFALQDAGFLARTIAAIRKLHQTEPLGARFDAFAQIDALADRIGKAGLAMPEDYFWLRRLVGQLEFMLEDVSLAPCRNDGSASNLMIGPGGAPLLIDFDRAGMNDPLYDIGLLLAETTDFERDMHAGFAAYAGAFDEVGFARARLWTLVDDMLHAMWGRLMAGKSTRGSVEWLKYGEWRLMRLRLGLNHPQFEEKIRCVREGT